MGRKDRRKERFQQIIFFCLLETSLGFSYPSWQCISHYHLSKLPLAIMNYNCLFILSTVYYIHWKTSELFMSYIQYIIYISWTLLLLLVFLALILHGWRISLCNTVLTCFLQQSLMIYSMRQPCFFFQPCYHRTWHILGLRGNDRLRSTSWVSFLKEIQSWVSPL